MALRILHRGHGMGKKAMFFTLIAIMIIMVFVVYFKMQTDIPVKQRMPVATARVMGANDFVASFENAYVPRALYAISHRALGSITICLNQTKLFSKNISKDFEDVVLTGRLSETRFSECNTPFLPAMEDNTMEDWLNKLTEVSKKELNMDITFKINGVGIEQDYDTGPWKARAVMDISYKAYSPGIANWTRNNIKISAIFDVNGFIDPYIAVMTDGKMCREINVTTITAEKITTLAMLTDIIRGGVYIFENTTAPSFLYRFEGNTSNSSCCGMESFIYELDKLYGGDFIEPGQPDSNDKYGMSYIDFEFWSGRCFDEKKLTQDNTKQLWNATELYTTFNYLKLDSYHRFKVYPVESVKYKEIKGISTRCTYVPPII